MRKLGCMIICIEVTIHGLIRRILGVIYSRIRWGILDGPDAYLYASGDPVNRVDQLGLYQSDIHYYMTYFLALAAGVDKDRAPHYCPG